MQARKKSTTFLQVIVRSFGEEPVRLVAHSIDRAKHRVFVGKETASQPISLPFTDVFDYSPDLFTQLAQAFQKGDTVTLQKIYTDLRGKKSCNRYQISVNSVHEKEPEIRDSGSAANSHEQ